MIFVCQTDFCLSYKKVLLIQAMVNAAGILSIRAEDTDLDENVKRRVSCMDLDLDLGLTILLLFF